MTSTQARADPEAAVRYWLIALAATLRATLFWPDPSYRPPASTGEVQRRLLRLMVRTCCKSGRRLVRRNRA